MKGIILRALASGTARRIAIVVVGLVIVPLNRKLGLNIPPEEVAATLLLLATYLVQSSWKEAAIAKAESQGQQAVAALPASVGVADGAVKASELAK